MKNAIPFVNAQKEKRKKEKKHLGVNLAKHVLGHIMNMD